MTANNSKSYLSYLNKLVDQYNNTYLHSVNKEPTNADYSALTEKIERNPKVPKFKVHDKVRILSRRILLLEDTLKIGQEKYLLLILKIIILKTNPWTYETKDLNGEKIIVKFMKKNCC